MEKFDGSAICREQIDAIYGSLLFQLVIARARRRILEIASKGLFDYECRFAHNASEV